MTQIIYELRFLGLFSYSGLLVREAGVREDLKQFSIELDALLKKYGIEIDHHCEFVSVVLDKTTGDLVGVLRGNDTEVYDD